MTARLVIGAEIIAVLLGMMVGVIGAVRQYSWFDYAATGVAFVLFSMPLFCLAVLLKFGGIELNNWLESHRLRPLDRHRRATRPGASPAASFEQIYAYTGAYILPTLCLVAIQFALYSRFQRASMLDTLNADYVRTARAKGLSPAPGDLPARLPQRADPGGHGVRAEPRACSSAARSSPRPCSAGAGWAR